MLFLGKSTTFGTVYTLLLEYCKGNPATPEEFQAEPCARLEPLNEFIQTGQGGVVIVFFYEHGGLMRIMSCHNKWNDGHRDQGNMSSLSFCPLPASRFIEPKAQGRRRTQ